jgi:hypothetical protein
MSSSVSHSVPSFFEYHLQLPMLCFKYLVFKLQFQVSELSNYGLEHLGSFIFLFSLCMGLN